MMRSRRFIPMVDGLSSRIAPSGSLGGGAVSADVLSPSVTSGDSGYSPMDLSTDTSGPYCGAILIDLSCPIA
jgi:hypothetical protein